MKQKKTETSTYHEKKVEEKFKDFNEYLENGEYTRAYKCIEEIYRLRGISPSVWSKIMSMLVDLISVLEEFLWSNDDLEYRTIAFYRMMLERSLLMLNLVVKRAELPF